MAITIRYFPKCKKYNLVKSGMLRDMKNDMADINSAVAFTPQNPLSFVVEKRLTKPDDTPTSAVSDFDDSAWCGAYPGVCGGGDESHSEVAHAQPRERPRRSGGPGITYHCICSRGRYRKAGGLGKMMNWHGPTRLTLAASGVFGVAFGKD